VQITLSLRFRESLHRVQEHGFSTHIFLPRVPVLRITGPGLELTIR
jgi:hypothetical protein